jgi:hypothetical protein
MPDPTTAMTRKPAPSASAAARARSGRLGDAGGGAAGTAISLAEHGARPDEPRVNPRRSRAGDEPVGG